MEFLSFFFIYREDIGGELECQGNNNNHTQPVLAKIAINMNRKLNKPELPRRFFEDFMHFLDIINS